ncbi:MAG TPA: hypothetical protein VND91_01920, partial [Candidatus Saccharimonadia bacterium]|nr:hypothetical protein [Candidatus Saccharimonadia bacterium]
SVAQLAQHEGDGEDAARAARAVLGELQGNVSLDGLGRLGLDLRGHWAFYGVGLVPVMRWQLRDPDAFRAFVARVEQRYGEKLPRGRAGKLEYWRFGGAGGELSALLAVDGKQLVATIAPNAASEPLVRQLLGVDLPDDSFADGDAIAALNSEYGFVPFGSGYLDVVRIATLVLDEKSGIEKEFLAALGLEGKARADPVCRTEMLAIAGKAPRMVTGYTRFDAAALDQVAVLELEPPLAAQLKSLATPVPGLGPTGNALVDFGMSLKLDKLKQAVDAHAGAVAAAPWQCSGLAQLNQAFADVQAQLSNPVSFAIAPVLQGFRVALSELELVEGGTPKYSGVLVVASPNPQSLVASARTFVPQLAGLKVEPGAAPVARPLDAAPPGTPPMHAAASAAALAVSFGAGEDARLAANLAAPAGDPAPLLAFGYDGSFMGRLLEFGETADDDMTPEARAEMEETMELAKQVYGSVFGRLDGSLVPTDRGLELRQSMRFK